MDIWYRIYEFETEYYNSIYNKIYHQMYTRSMKENETVMVNQRDKW